MPSNGNVKTLDPPAPLLGKIKICVQRGYCRIFNFGSFWLKNFSITVLLSTFSQLKYGTTLPKRRGTTRHKKTKKQQSIQLEYNQRINQIWRRNYNKNHHNTIRQYFRKPSVTRTMEKIGHNFNLQKWRLRKYWKLHTHQQHTEKRSPKYNISYTTTNFTVE